MKRDGNRTSIWQHSVEDSERLDIIDSKEYDVVIIGAGITGVTTALLLQQAGKSCIIAEAKNPGFGTTGGTTAHLNNFYDTPYSKIIKDFGEDDALLMAQGAKAAIGLIKTNIETQQIDCDFEEKDAWLFAVDEKQNKMLDDIVSSANKVGVLMEYTDKSPFPIPHLKLARVPGQAQFNPMRYLNGLLEAFSNAGGKLIQQCRVTDIIEGDVLSVETTLGTIRARNAIYATHIPPGVNLLHFRCAPYRSYAMGVKIKFDEYPNGLGYDLNDPYYYYRTQEIDGEQYMIIGGEDHKTGHEDNTEQCFRRLESHIRTHFRVEEISFRWSSQYFEPTDGLPYIGNLPGKGSNLYVATGYGGNGMIYGPLAGLILSNILVNGESIYQELLDPNRLKPMAGFTNFVKEGADVVKQLVGALLPTEKLKEIADLAAGEARVVKLDGQVMGLYKDEQGALHAVNSACTHIKCTVNWNGAEKSWDCPCHGSRFSYDGEVLTAPALKPLQKVDIP